MNLTHNKLKSYQLKNKQGFSLVEIILSSALFVLIVTAYVAVYLYGQEATAMAGNRARAVMLAEEGLEAVRNIRDAAFVNLTDGNHGLVVSSNQWIFSGSQDITNNFTRQINISTINTNTKQLRSTVTWQQNPRAGGQVVLATYLTNWQAIIAITTCNDFAIQQGYSAGTCRANTQQCRRNNETHLPSGDTYCTGGQSADTCCALP